MTPFPDFSAQYLSDIGVELKNRNRLGTAIIALRKAVALGPQHHVILNNLGCMLAEAQQYDEAIAWFHKALALAPEFQGANLNLGLCYFSTGRFREAERYVALAKAYGTPDHQAAWELGAIRLIEGDWLAGWPDYESRLQDKAHPLPALTMPRWNGEPLAGKTIWIAGEQGAGDLFMAARYLRWLADQGARVVLSCLPQAMSLMRGYDGVADIAHVEKKAAQADYWEWLMSLPMRHGTTPGNVPPEHGSLRAAAKDSTFRLPAPRPGTIKVGLCWAGNGDNKKDHQRSTILPQMFPLLADPRFSFYSLQVGPRSQEIAHNGAESLICDLAGDLKIWRDTAKAITQLDVVISVCTGTAHLAAALGVPTWVMLCYTADWRWLRDRSDCPWWPTARLFRQKHPGDWDVLVLEVKEALQVLIEQREAA